MTFDAVLFWGMMPAKMTFRPFNLDICRAGVAGLLFFAGAWGLRAGEPIEVVPFQGSARVDTNFDHALPSDSQNLEAMFPRAAHSFGRPQPGARNVPLPPQNPGPSDRERQLQDRRRNWVFMTPEDFAKPGDGKDLSLDDEKDGTGKPATAMERYYQHLYNLNQSSATNQLGSMKPDRDSWATNSFWSGDTSKGDSDFAGSSPFNTSPDAGIFQPATKSSEFGNVFSSSQDSTLRSPEEVRLEAEQKAHMDSFKELWNMAPPPAASVSTPTPVAASAGSGFNSAQSSLQPALNALGSSSGNGSSSSPQPMQRTVTSMRNSGPPHASFAPPQNPF